MNCQDISERTVDFLYEELPVAERTAFEAHLAGCESCRREVASLQQVRTHARSALKGQLAEDPPAGVRSRVLKAAAAAMPSGAVRSGPATSSAGVADSFWQWLRRPWVIPALATASIMAVFVLTREAVLNPERPASVPVASPPAVPEPAMQEKARAAAEEAVENKPADKDDSLTVPRSKAKGDEGVRPRPLAKSRFAVPPPPVPRMGPGGRGESGALGGRLDQREEPAPQVASAPARSRELERRPAAPPAASRPAAAASAGAIAAAPPPSPREDFDDVERAPAKGSIAVRKQKEAKKAEVAADEAVAVAEAQAPAAAPAPAPVMARRQAVVPLDELIRRADRQFREGQWREAAASYQELLRRYPTHKDVALWKQRLAAATQAIGR